MFSRSSSPALLRTAAHDAAVVVEVAGPSLTHRHSEALRRETDAVRDADGSRPSLLVIDLSNVRDLDSAGLGVLVAVVKAARDDGRDACLCDLQPNVRVLVELVRLHELIDIYHTAEESLRAAAARPSEPADLQAAVLDRVGEEIDAELSDAAAPNNAASPSELLELDLLR